MEFRSRAVSPRHDPVFADLINCETTNRLRLFSLRGKTARSQFLRCFAPAQVLPFFPATCHPFNFSAHLFPARQPWRLFIRRSFVSRRESKVFFPPSFPSPSLRSSFELQREERTTRVKVEEGKEIFLFQDEGEIRGDEVG